MRFIDLSVAIEHKLPSDPPPTQQDITYLDHAFGAGEMTKLIPGITISDLPSEQGWAVEDVKLNTHSGTHVDAPWHYSPVMNGTEKARTIDEMPLEYCFSDGVVVDFRNKGDGYLVTPKDFQEAFSAMGYRLKPKDIVLVLTGAMSMWGKPAYMGKGCGMGRDSTLWLLDQGVKVTGTDAWSWDRPLPVMAKEFAEKGDKRIIWEAHYAGMEKEYYHMEKMANLDLLPSFGFKVACFPMKIKKASAGWVRAVAMLD
jgi:kynurenine formamidase